MINLKSSPGKFIAYAVVRDSEGNPKIDDPQNLHPEIFKGLTDTEVERIYGSALPEHLKNVKRG